MGFDDSQPRDEAGRWTSGGGGTAQADRVSFTDKALDKLLAPDPAAGRPLTGMQKLSMQSAERMQKRLNQLPSFKHLSIDALAMSKVDVRLHPDIEAAFKEMGNLYGKDFHVDSLTATKLPEGILAETGAISAGSVGMKLNSTLWNSAGKVGGAITESHNTGFLAGDRPESVIVHELGHALVASSSMAADSTGHNPRATALLGEARVYAGKNRPSARDLSTYGASQPEEAWAEAVSAAVTMPDKSLTPWEHGFKDALSRGLQRVRHVTL